MKNILFLALGLTLLIAGCKLVGPEEKAIGEMLETFTTAVDSDDESLAMACLLDRSGFRLLNPDASARSDAEGYTETFLADLIHNFRDLASYFKNRDVAYKKLLLGTPWYQYKGHAAFKDNTLVVSADGEEVEIAIRGLVRLGDRWLIVDLSGNEYFY